MFIPDTGSGFFLSQIQQKKRREKNRLVPHSTARAKPNCLELQYQPILQSVKCLNPTRRWPWISQNLKYLIFWTDTEKDLSPLKQNVIAVFLTQGIVTNLSEMWVRSGIRKKLIPDPGVKKALDPESGSATLHRMKRWIEILIWKHTYLTVPILAMHSSMCKLNLTRNRVPYLHLTFLARLTIVRIRNQYYIT